MTLTCLVSDGIDSRGGLGAALPAPSDVLVRGCLKAGYVVLGHRRGIVRVLWLGAGIHSFRVVKAHCVEAARGERARVAKEGLATLVGLPLVAGRIGVNRKREQSDRPQREDDSGNALHRPYSCFSGSGAVACRAHKPLPAAVTTWVVFAEQRFAVKATVLPPEPLSLTLWPCLICPEALRLTTRGRALLSEFRCMVGRGGLEPPTSVLLAVAALRWS